MRIAIVDDVASERENLHERLKIQLKSHALYAKISEFELGAPFLSAAQEHHFDLVFLDIYMADENGIETARLLREFDGKCILVFTTSSMDHALDGFRVRAFQYLVKPYSDDELTALFDELVQRLPESDPYLEISTANGIVRLRFQDIVYAEHYLHQIHILTIDNREITTRQTFREFKDTLIDDRFFVCSRGTIINLTYAEDFDGTNFLLKNNKKIPVSRSLSKSARLAFGDYLFKRGRHS